MQNDRRLFPGEVLHEAYIDLCTCGLCHSTLHLVKRNGKHAYVCRDGCASIMADRLDQQTLAQVRQNLAEPAAAALRSVIDSIDKLRSAWHSSTLTDEDCASQLTALVRKKAGLHAVLGSDGTLPSDPTAKRTILDGCIDHIEVLGMVTADFSSRLRIAWRDPNDPECLLSCPAPPCKAA